VPRNTYDAETAAAFGAVREIPRDGLSGWRDAVRRHLRPAPGATLVDVGAGTGQFAVAFSEWFGVDVVAVEPSAAMRARIARSASVHVREGSASALPLADASADGAWLSLVLHHVPDLHAAARELRRVLRPGAPVLIRQGFPDRYEPLGPLRGDTIEVVRWFPETARVVETFPSLAETCDAFAAAGLRREAVEQVRENYPGSLADLLAATDALRRADTTLRSLTEDEFRRGRERLRRAVETGAAAPRTNTLDLLVLR
jgi:ubiquinone/menaquinone biosynthesis C-methylase UbiE